MHVRRHFCQLPRPWTELSRPIFDADFKKLDYFSTECTYSPTAYRGHARALVKDLERVRPSSILDIIYSGEAMASAVELGTKRPVQRACDRVAPKARFR